MNQTEQATALHDFLLETLRRQPGPDKLDLCGRLNYLERHGFELEGVGHFSFVYSHPKFPDVVVKLSRHKEKDYIQDGFEAYFDFLSAAQRRSKMALRVFIKSKHDIFDVFVVEKLEAIPAAYDDDEVGKISTASHLANNRLPPDPAVCNEKAFRFCMRLMEFVRKTFPDLPEIRFDLHANNILRRPGTGDLVIADPLVYN